MTGGEETTCASLCSQHPLTATHTLKLQGNYSASPCPSSPPLARKYHRGLLTLSSVRALPGGRHMCLGHPEAAVPPGRWPRRSCWHLPRLARLRVRTPSAVVLSPPTQEVFSTAFMFSCSAASSAYCRPWGWPWEGGEVLENLPDCGRKEDLLF